MWNEKLCAIIIMVRDYATQHMLIIFWDNTNMSSPKEIIHSRRFDKLAYPLQQIFMQDISPALAFAAQKKPQKKQYDHRHRVKIKDDFFLGKEISFLQDDYHFVNGRVSPLT